MKLAGDIGGTKTNLALVDTLPGGALRLIREMTFDSGAYLTFESLLDAFLVSDDVIDSACFGIAGPIINQTCQTTNLPWFIDGEQLKTKFGTPKVRLLNDLEAMAIGMRALDDDDLVALNPGVMGQSGNIAVIAAGTGLGEAILYWDGEQYHPIATEGGHGDLAAQTPLQDQLVQYLRHRFKEHVSYERILSGDGFGHLYDFLVSTQYGPPCEAVPIKGEGDRDRNAVISRLGLHDEDPVCREVLRLFVEIYGAEAGNLALKALSIGGLYIGGGIGPKILPFLKNGDFMRSFTAKGRFGELLAKIPVRVSLNPKTPLLGAMHYFP